jgi:putative ABC transport system substrate-binding protein
MLDLRRRQFLTLLGGAAAAWPQVARVQQPARLPRIGILWPNPVTASGHFVDAFRQGLGELGYIEGRNMTIEFRTAEGTVERLPDLAAELVRLPVEVILTATSPTIRAAQQATRTIPIVMGNSQDPVSEGFVASLARPGGNITGLTLFSPDIAAKRLQLVKEVAPTLTRVARSYGMRTILLWPWRYERCGPQLRCCSWSFDRSECVAQATSSRHFGRQPRTAPERLSSWKTT